MHCRRISTITTAAAGLCLSLSCQSASPDPAAEAAIVDALNLGAPLTFRVEGGPLDEEAAGSGLTFAGATRRAVTTDPALQAALAQVRIALADADQARLLPNPILDVVLRFGSGSPQIELGLGQDLVRTLQTGRRASAADDRLRQAAAGAVTVALDVAAAVQEQYVVAQAWDRLVPELEARVELLRRLAAVAGHRLDAGEGTRGDLSSLEAQRVDLELEVAESKQRQRQERLRLARLIGEPSSAAAWTLDPWAPTDVELAEEKLWIETALQRRPELQVLHWRLSALGADMELVALLPWEGGEAGVRAEKAGDWSLGPALTTPLPLFDSGQAREDRLRAEQIAASHELTLARRQAVEEVRVAYQNIVAGRANLERIRAELLPLQEQRRQATEDVYRVENDLTPLLLAEQDLRAAQALAIVTERQTALALVRLHRAVGGPAAAALINPSPVAIR